MAIPHIIDQFLWGQKLHVLGVGPRPIPREKLTPKNLASALMQMRDDSRMRQKAAELGEAIHAERGVENAVALIEEHFGAARA
jgi:UDP:flavonoid glycosyltransferase YjiC (YdhE family)